MEYGYANDLFDPEKLDHASLARLRDLYGSNSDFGRYLAPYEHQAFAREWTQEAPYIAPLALAAATPAYYLAKQPMFSGLSSRLGLVGPDASPPSLEQVLRGYRGIGQGLRNLFR